MHCFNAFRRTSIGCPEHPCLPHACRKSDDCKKEAFTDTFNPLNLANKCSLVSNYNKPEPQKMAKNYFIVHFLLIVKSWCAFARAWLCRWDKQWPTCCHVALEVCNSQKHNMYCSLIARSPSFHRGNFVPALFGPCSVGTQLKYDTSVNGNCRLVRGAKTLKWVLLKWLLYFAPVEKDCDGNLRYYHQLYPLSIMFQSWRRYEPEIY